ncbi:MAG: excinuclease abc c subunit domain protein [Parcubacteria group bacterium Athens0714_16]|nr:MAG: excinuclease abc c subunit domain protein [Parcubacteria group bacterium Athens0714_16]
MYFLYILQSEKDKKFYVGITSDIEKRLKYHNSGRVNSTKHRIPFFVVYSERYPDRKCAREREVFLKSYKGSGEKRDIIKMALSSNG